MLRGPLALLVPAALLCSSCDQPEPTQGSAPASAAPSGSVAPALGSERKSRPAGAVPFEFPSTTTAARKGDFVLAPPRAWIDEAFEKGGESQTFIYYGAWMQAPGPADSLIETLPGQDVRVPNSMILTVGSGHTAVPGDVVLTAWASGSGMQRAIVVEGGAPETPRVRYLDLELGSSWAEKDDELPKGTFRVLSKPGELGTTLACKDGKRRTRWVAVAEAEGKFVGLGYAGKMRVLVRADCVALPVSPKLAAGAKAFVPVAGVFAEAKVAKVDAKLGRITAKYELGSGVKEEIFSFTNVASEL